VRRFAGVRVLVVGDLMLDQFVWDACSAFSPEAPVPVVQVDARRPAPRAARQTW